ncbi:MAG: ABC transporter ATP-binding protein [Methanomicrobiaceae archaeon]|nr:ABC transporter ATP-binding protein [Methanomicrobiaceae archaeon]
MYTIEVTDLTKAFDGKTVLGGISFRVREGEVFGFLGPNGAGKTTTMRILLGLLKPTSGMALVEGEDPGARDDIRGRIGVLLENNGLYARLNAYENLDYYARIYRVPDRESRIQELLSFAGLQDAAQMPVGNFSTGMKRKLALARAIIHDPAILFLDEPTTGLDPEAQAMVRDLIIDLSREQKRTVFLNSHNLDEVSRICTNVAILHEGTIRAYDSVERLRGSPDAPVYAITATTPEMAERACEILRGYPGILSCSRDGAGVTVSLALSDVPGMLREVIGGGVDVVEVTRMRRSLEEVYLDVVHRAGGAA